MVLTLAKKLNLAFLGLTLVILLSTLGLARWSFEKGFLDYVNALELARLRALATSLAWEYRQAGDAWSTLDEPRFVALLWQYSPDNPEEQLRSGMSPPPDSPFTPPADHFSAPRDEGPARLGPPTALYGLDGRLIAGILPSVADLEPIRVTVSVDGQPVGELRSAPRRRFDSPQETAFSRQQWLTSGVIGVIALLLALLVSLLLTRLLLAPIRRAIAGISRLSGGDYAIRLNEQRKDELGQLMGDLDRLAHTLEENRSARQRWLADISHELRTPVTVLTGEIEAIKDGIRPLDMEQVHSLDQEVARLRRLIDDLYQLSVSDIGGLRYAFSRVDIGATLAAAVAAVRLRAEEKGIAVSVNGLSECLMSGDGQRLDQLLVNLLENALAYTDAPGRIEITLACTGDGIILTIEDTPPGVDAAACERLFEPLYRHELSRSRRTAGVGLGLAICRNIVDAHQGRITASPSGLGGLCIRVVFPLSPGETA